MVGAPATAGVAHDTKEPGSAVAAGEGPEVAKGAQRRFLHDILGIVLIPHQPASEPMRGVKMRQNDVVKTLVDRTWRSRFNDSTTHEALRELLRFRAQLWDTG